MPGGAVHLQIDALSAFFLLPVFGLSIVTAIYGGSYLRAGASRVEPRQAGFFLNLLTAGMAAVIAAHDGLLFLVAWEIMALSPFFLVIFDDRRRRCGMPPGPIWPQPISERHFCSSFSCCSASWPAARISRPISAVLKDNPALCSAVFVLALIGFGSKAGIVPAHVWLPEAHPVAPSHASALMSGAMIKVGIYGLVRILTLLGTPQPWWGWVLIAIGASSGVLGVLFALAQHDLKRLLAYSQRREYRDHPARHRPRRARRWRRGMPALAAIGFAAGLLHVLNHSDLQGAAVSRRRRGAARGAQPRFRGARRAVEAHAVDRRGVPDRRRGDRRSAAAQRLRQRVPAVLCGLYCRRRSRRRAPRRPAWSRSSSMGLISGLAAACFAKAFGIVFLGAPRSRRSRSRA